MLAAQQIQDANAYGETLRLAVNELALPANNRVRAAAACLSIAQDHHHAILVLLENGLYASSFALVRVAFEAYVRGAWLALCAKDSFIRRFLKGTKPPEIEELLKDLEGAETFRGGALTLIKRRTWKAMCGFTHTGGIHVQRWNTVAAIEPNYSEEELFEILRFAEIILSLAVAGVATLATDDALSQRVLTEFMRRIGE